MIKYFCNRCDKNIEIGKFTMAIKDPKGEQETLHFCQPCMKILKPILNGEEIKSAVSDIVKEIKVGAPQNDINEEDTEKTVITETVNNSQDSIKEPEEKTVITESVNDTKSEAKEVTENEPKAEERNVEEVQEGTETSGTETEKKEPEVRPVAKPKPVIPPRATPPTKQTTPKAIIGKPRAKAVLPKKVNDNTEPVAVAKIPTKPVDDKKEDAYESRVNLKTELPTPPNKKANLDGARRVLIDFYKGVAPKTTIQRQHIDSANYYYILKRYGSTIIRDRYTEKKEWADPDGKSIKAMDLLSLYAGGFSIQRIADEEFYIDMDLVLEIIRYYTGI